MCQSASRLVIAAAVSAVVYLVPALVPKARAECYSTGFFLACDDDDDPGLDFINVTPGVVADGLMMFAWFRWTESGRHQLWVAAQTYEPLQRNLLVVEQSCSNGPDGQGACHYALFDADLDAQTGGQFAAKMSKDDQDWSFCTLVDLAPGLVERLYSCEPLD